MQKEFLDKLEKYGIVYSPQYLKSFADYWGKTIEEKKGKLRFENEESFFLPTYLENWKEKQKEIKLQEEYNEIISQSHYHVNLPGRKQYVVYAFFTFATRILPLDRVCLLDVFIELPTLYQAFCANPQNKCAIFTVGHFA